MIANRGEIACRIARSCRKLGIASVAVCSEPDRHARHVRMADEYRVIGPARAQHSYLNIQNLLDAAHDSDADAIHPGYGFLAESAIFAQSVVNAGLVWIGPKPETIKDMGDKERARSIAENSGVPVLPASRRFEVGNLDGLDAAASRIGFPVLVKASAGGGGIGMVCVDDPDRLHKAVESTQKNAVSSFGNGAVFLEKFVPEARHIEVQIIGMGDGRAIHLFERECSIQRRFQKVIEEAPSPAIDVNVSTRKAITAAAVRLAQSQSYSGAGTVEFVLDSMTGTFYFLEMNTRVQVEHTITEMITGVDIVDTQIQIADSCDAGLCESNIGNNGHAIELRICAEDPDAGFLPNPGLIERFVVPQDDIVFRLDTGYEAGDEVLPYYDSLLAKLVVRGNNREDCIDRAIYALDHSHIEGVKTNLCFLSNVLKHQVFRQGKTLTSFIDSYKKELLQS